MLVGDVNSSKTVNSSDIGAVKAQSGAPVTAANFRADVAVSGTHHRLRYRPGEITLRTKRAVATATQEQATVG